MTMQSIKPWRKYNSVTHTGILHGLTTGRRSLGHRKMCSIIVVLTDVLVHQSLQVAFIQNNHLVEQISTAASDPELNNAVLPRTSDAGSFWLDVQYLDGTDHLLIEISRSVEDQILWSRIVRKCFSQLLHGPSTIWMPGHIAVKDTPPIMRYD
jgi:hypothetical protein